MPTPPATASALVAVKSGTATSTTQSRKLYPCVFCKGTHLNRDCTKCQTPESRKQSLLKQGRCFLCLRTGHLVTACPNRRRHSCSNCGRTGHHHQLLCSDNTPEQIQETESHDIAGVATAETSLLTSSGVVRLQLAQVRLLAAMVNLFMPMSYSTVAVIDPTSHRSWLMNWHCQLAALKCCMCQPLAKLPHLMFSHMLSVLTYHSRMVCLFPLKPALCRISPDLSDMSLFHPLI